MVCPAATEPLSPSAGTARAGSGKPLATPRPAGLCGSGLIDLLAELRRYDLMTPKGVFADKKRLFELVPNRGITFSRLDASNLAQAKAANFCGQYIVLRTLGLDPSDVQQLYLAGGFANYVDVQAAIDIGFLAPVPKRASLRWAMPPLKVRAKCCSPLANAPASKRWPSALSTSNWRRPPTFLSSSSRAAIKPMPRQLTAASV